MIRHCKCGGRVQSAGSRENCQTGERWALFECDKCHKKYQQKKRGPIVVEWDEDDDHLTEADYQTWMRL